MATEKGIVIKADRDIALVKTTRSSSCESCASRRSCHETGNGKEMEVEVINIAGAKEGDNVVLNFDTSALLKASFLLYVFPILVMIFGALLGQYFAPFLNLDPSGTSFVTGFLLFIISFGFIRYRGNKMAQKREYQPKITKIL